MLERQHRLTRSAGFAAAIRRGRRAGTRTLVVHLLVPTDGSGPPTVGLVVGRGVGNAVVRNQVKRRLRAQARDRLPSLPGAAALVLRALPAAGTATSAELGADLDRALDRALAGVTRSRSTPGNDHPGPARSAGRASTEVAAGVRTGTGGGAA